MNIGDYFDGYRIDQFLGGGTYGEVYLGTKDEEHYALKFLRNRKDGTGFDIGAFSKEKETWKKVSGHPNILKIHEALIKNGKYVLVTDFADGGPLSSRPASADEALVTIIEVLDGVRHLHNLNIVHRDIKPDNILLRNGVPCLCDFGLARDLDLTHSTTRGLGTVLYSSPELINQNPDFVRHPANDLWATAVTFFRLLTGEMPFSLGSLVNLNEVVFPGDFPDDLIGFFRKAFRPAPADRFQTADEMIRELRSIERTRFERRTAAAMQERIDSELRLQYEQEFDSLREMNRILEEQLDRETAESSRKIQKRDDEIRELRAKIIQFGSQSYFEKEKQKFEDEKTALRSRIEALTTKTAELEAWMERDQKENLDFRKKLKSYRERIAELEAAAENHDREKADLQKEIGGFDDRFQQFEERLKAGREKLAKAENANRELVTKHSNQEAKILELNQKNKELNSQIVQKNKEISAHLESSKKIRKQLKDEQAARLRLVSSGSRKSWLTAAVVCIFVAGLMGAAYLIDKNMQVSNLKQVAEGCVKNENFKCAIGIYEQAIAKFPQDSDVYTALGDIYRYKYKEGLNQVKAIELYNKVLTELDRNNTDAIFGLGYSYEMLDNYEKAIEYYERCNKTPGCGAELNLASVYSSSSNPKPDFEKAKKLFDNLSTNSFVKPEKLVRFYADNRNPYKSKPKAEQYYLDFLKKEEEYKKNAWDFEATRSEIRKLIDALDEPSSTTDIFKPNLSNSQNANDNSYLKQYLERLRANALTNGNSNSGNASPLKPSNSNIVRFKLK